MKQKTIIYELFTIFLISTLILTASIPTTKAAQIQEDDPKDDVWKISMLDFFYVIGDEFPDRPESISEVEDVIEKLVTRSEQVKSPNCIDIEEIYINTDDPTYGAVIIEMEDDIKDCDFVMVIVILEDSNDNWVEMEMEWDESDGEDYEWSSENWEGNDTTGGISGEQIGIVYPKSECAYEDGDDYIVLAFTFNGDFDDPLHSIFYYDFAPNSLVEPTEEGLYQGNELITTFMDDVSHFLFGWLFRGYLPFLLFIALLLTGFQVLLDRKNKISHWIGFGCLLFMLWPIFWYSISLNLVGVLGLPDIFSLSALIILVWFSIFIVLSLLNSFGVFKRYRFAFITACVSMSTIQIMHIIFLMTQEQVINLFILIAALLSLIVILKISKKYGRNPFKEE